MQQKRAVQGLEEGPGAVPGDAHCTQCIFSRGQGWEWACCVAQR